MASHRQHDRWQEFATIIIIIIILRHLSLYGERWAGDCRDYVIISHGSRDHPRPLTWTCQRSMARWYIRSYVL